MQLAKEAGIEAPTDDQLRQFDRTRKGKKTSNDDWQSPSDPDARITQDEGRHHGALATRPSMPSTSTPRSSSLPT